MNDSFAVKELGFLCGMDANDTFDAELVAEWIMNGIYSDKKIASLSEDNFTEVEEEIASRWTECDAEAFGDKWISLTS